MPTRLPSIKRTDRTPVLPKDKRAPRDYRKSKDLVTSGTCRSCGCTEDKACTLSVMSSDRCSEVLTPTWMRWTCQWVDDSRTRCSACFAAFPVAGTKRRTFRKIAPPDHQLIVLVSRPGQQIPW